MFHRKPVAAALIIVGLMATTTAQAAQQCLPPREAEALILALAPSLIQQVSTTCAANLPGNAYLRRSSGTLSAKFAGEADAVADAIRDHYKPVSAEAPVAPDDISACVALADAVHRRSSGLRIGRCTALLSALSEPHRDFRPQGNPPHGQEQVFPHRR